jgi:HIRAN domain
VPMGLFRRRLEPETPRPAAPTVEPERLAEPPDTPYQRYLAELGAHFDEDPDTFTSVAIVGESFRQAELERISGPKDEDEKRMVVGVTLRCEPDNKNDPNAVRVEVMGQHVGYVKRGRAKQLHPRMADRCGGAIECVGMILGGWRYDDDDEGYYGIRVWLRRGDRARLGLKE